MAWIHVAVLTLTLTLTLTPSPNPKPSPKPNLYPNPEPNQVLGLENLVAGGAGTTRKSRFGFEKVIEAVQGCKKPFVELDVGGRSWKKRVRAGERPRRCRGDVGERWPHP